MTNVSIEKAMRKCQVPGDGEGRQVLVSRTRAEIGRQKKERTSVRLIDAAMRVIARLGPDMATIDDVIAEAAVARGTFYNYFNTLNEVFVAVGVGISDQLIVRMAADRHFADPALRVGAAVRRFIQLAVVDSNAGWVIVRIALPTAPIGDRMRDEIARDLSDGIRTGRFQVHSAQAASDAVLGLGMMGMRSVLRNDAGPEHAEHIAEMVLRALGVPDAAEIARHPLAELARSPDERSRGGRPRRASQPSKAP